MIAMLVPPFVYMTNIRTGFYIFHSVHYNSVAVILTDKRTQLPLDHNYIVKNTKLLHVSDINDLSSGRKLLHFRCNNSVRYTYALYTEQFPSVLLHVQQIKIIKILLSNCCLQQQLTF